MLRKQGMCLVAAFALTMALAGPVADAHAGPAAPRLAAPDGLTEIWSRVQDWLGAALPWTAVTAATCDRGASIDPDGHCASVVAPPSDRGFMIDPNGG